MKPGRVEERSEARDARKDYSIEYELTKRESMLDQRDDEFSGDSDHLPTEAGNGNGRGSGTGNVCSSLTMSRSHLDQ
jgi:hypothetical protein